MTRLVLEVAWEPGGWGVKLYGFNAAGSQVYAASTPLYRTFEEALARASNEAEQAVKDATTVEEAEVRTAGALHHRVRRALVKHGRVAPKVCKRCGAQSSGGHYCPNGCGRLP